MVEQQPYWEIPGLQEIYLEDSYVLGIREDGHELAFDMEFVLREGHALFEAPGPERQYCYRRGSLIFRGVEATKWIERRSVASWDASGEQDLGNIDSLINESGWFKLEGDWGSVHLRAARVEAALDS